MLMMALLVFPCIAAADAVTIAKTVPYADGVGTDAVKKECLWNTELSTALVEFAKPDVTLAAGELDQVQGKVLSMTVTHLHTAGGGFYAGPKWATIKGELRDGASVVGSFYANRTTTQGMGACAALSRIGRAIAKDISLWLKAPSMGAKLGDAK
jgi:hypothetical protein